MKRKATITIKKGEGYIGVDFWGYNEGSASPCKDEKEAKEHIDYLLKRWSSEYDIQVIDKRVRQTTLWN